MRPIRGRTLARARPGRKRSRIKLVPLSPASHYRSFSTAGYWTPQRATLRQRYRIVTYDQSGTGAERDVGRTCRGNQGRDPAHRDGGRSRAERDGARGLQFPSAGLPRSPPGRPWPGLPAGLEFVKILGRWLWALEGETCMAATCPVNAGDASWSVEDIPYHTLVHDRVRDDRRLFYILASASFIEITSDLYTRNLVEFFRPDSEIVDWLEGNWEKEELQHGAALKRYVQTAWPAFDWEAAYKLFVAEYSQCCTVEQLAGTRALEMAARCVVETGTATFYRMMSELSREPVLKRLAAEISADEVRHYKHFYRYFQRYRSLEQPSRVAILRTLLNRAAEVEA